MLFCSIRTDPISRISEASFGNIPITPERRFSSRFSRSMWFDVRKKRRTIINARTGHSQSWRVFITSEKEVQAVAAAKKKPQGRNRQPKSLQPEPGLLRNTINWAKNWFCWSPTVSGREFRSKQNLPYRSIFRITEETGRWRKSDHKAQSAYFAWAPCFIDIKAANVIRLF